MDSVRLTEYLETQSFPTRRVRVLDVEKDSGGSYARNLFLRCGKSAENGQRKLRSDDRASAIRRVGC